MLPVASGSSLYSTSGGGGSCLGLPEVLLAMVARGILSWVVLVFLVGGAGGNGRSANRIEIPFARG